MLFLKGTTEKLFPTFPQYIKDTTELSTTIPRMHHTILIIFLSLLVVSPVPIVRAATYDGTYDFAYNYYKGGEWITRRVPSGIIIKNSRISSNPSGLSGSVDASGNVRFQGTCPYGDNTAVYTGTLSSSGTGKGTYRCSYGHYGSWRIDRISSPGLFGFSFDEILIWGVSSIAVLGTSLAVARAITNALHKRTTVSQENAPTQTGTPYQVSQPPPATSHEIPPSTIGIPPPPKKPEAGVGVSSSTQSSSLSLGVDWSPGQVTLNWDQPVFDSSEYQLAGYEISRMQYGPTSTAPTKELVAQLPPGSQQWTSAFNQTYKWNTRGDTEGYVVEALFRRVSSTGHVETYRVGAMARAPYPPI